MIKVLVVHDSTFYMELGLRLDSAPQRFADYVTPTLSQVENSALGVLRRYPDRLPRLPFIWSVDPQAQARARRWWFAHLRETGQLRVGGRYQRTGQLGAAWRIVTVYTQTGDRVIIDIVANNPSRGAAYVYGLRQVPSHTLTGWPQTTKLGEQITLEVNPAEKVMDAWVKFWQW